MNLETSLKNALSLFEGGDVTACADVCREVLRNDARQPQALFLLGLSYHRRGETATALDCLYQAMEMAPGDPAIRYNYSVMLLELQRPVEAITHLLILEERFPGRPEVSFLLGNALTGTGRHEEALCRYRHAIAGRAEYVEARFNLGMTLKHMGRYDEAAESFASALGIAADPVPILFQLSLVHYSRGDMSAAIDSLRQLLDKDPAHAEAARNLGILLLDVEQASDALPWLEEAARRHPQDAGTYNSLGAAYREVGRLAEAEAVLRQALAIDPTYAEALSNLGNVLCDGQQFAAAIRQYEQALAVRPSLHTAWYNLGKCYDQLLAPEQAIAMYRQAIANKPDLVEAHWNLSHALLLIGQYEEGFREYLWRWRRKATPKMPLPKPEWAGAPLPNQTLLVLAEQGLGDAIQFVRYLPLARERVGKLYLACPQSLIPLFQSLAGVDAILSQENISALANICDVYVPLLNMPSLFPPPNTPIPSQVPYLAADQKRLDEFAPIFAQAGGRRKVGLVWRGNPTHQNDANRSCPFAALSPLLERQDITLYSLQKGGDETSDAFTNLAPYLDSFADTAAIMTHLDLVISVDTSAAHLAGALARPVWLLLPHVPEWRWGLEVETTPWYPTMRLFRQPRRGDWTGVMEQLRAALDADRS